MPVTFTVAAHTAEAVHLDICRHEAPLLWAQLADGGDEGKPEPVRLAGSDTGDSSAYMPRMNGFVNTIVHAYNEHHHLTLRPEDVWGAIMVQFSFYLNANAEALRNRFVDFEGKKRLTVETFGTLFSVDYGAVAQMMTEQIALNIKDPSVREWVLPDFSTTTWSDKVVGSVVLMASMQKYFEYCCCIKCGLPSVTLLGTLQDWEAVAARADRLPQFDCGNGNLKAWHALLAPVLAQFVAAARGEADVSFWGRVCHYKEQGSGVTYLCGWVTVFTVFNSEGGWLATSWGDDDLAEWPIIQPYDVASGIVTVPMTVDDDGKLYNTTMTAGHFGSNVISDGKGLQPALHWKLALDAQPGKPQAASRQPQAGQPVSGLVRPKGSTARATSDSVSLSLSRCCQS